jgi:molybdenum cofactor biosynthesis enzyme MoaA
MSTAGTALPSDYGPLVRELHRRAAAFRQPVNGTFELTERCNLACRMCYVCQAPSDAARRAKELSVPAWLELARDAVDNGMVFLLLTGGEIFLRPDFLDLYTPLTRTGLVVNLFTNGTLISDRVAARLAEAPPSRTEITLYGATAATYEAVTGVPGSYTRCCAGIEALVKHRVPLSLKTTITRHNVDELDAMRGGWRTTGACHFRLAGCSPNGATERCRRFPIAACLPANVSTSKRPTAHPPPSGPNPSCANRPSTISAIFRAKPARPPLSSIRRVR